MKMKIIWLLSFFVFSSCAHRESVQYDLNSTTTNLKIQNHQLKVIPYKRVSFNQKQDVLMLKFVAKRGVELNQILENQIVLSSNGLQFHLLDHEGLKSFAAQEEGYNSSLKKGFPIGSTYNQGQLLKYFAEKRLVKFEEARRPSSFEGNYYYEFFLVPKKASIDILKLKYLAEEKSFEAAINVNPPTF